MAFFRKSKLEPQAAPKEDRAGLKSIENPGVPLSSATFFSQMGWNTNSFKVNSQSALQVPAVWCAILFYADTIASLPLNVYKKKRNGESTKQGGALQRMLHDAINDTTTSFMWRHSLIHSLLTDGRSYTLIERNNAGMPIALHLLEYGKVTPAIVYTNGIPALVYRHADVKTPYKAADIIDIAWLMESDGVTHVNPVNKLAKTIRLAIAQQEYADKFFTNGGVPPLALQGPFSSPGAVQNASNDVQQAIQTASAEGKMVLPIPTGNELKPIGFDPQKGQMLDSRRFIIEEVARMYRLSPIFLQDMTVGTFNNTEQQDIQVSKHSIAPILERIEQEINLKLFGRNGSNSYIEFNIDGLQRGDFLSRIRGISEGVRSGTLTPNEGRALDNRQPLEGGDELYMQKQMTPIRNAGEENNET